MSDARWLSVKEAAEALGVSVATVYGMADKGLIAHYRVGTGRGRLNFKPADVDAYLESKRTGPAVKKVAPSPRRAFPVPLEDHFAKGPGRGRRRP